MFYDLNVQWSSNTHEVEHTISFLSERYNVVALSHPLSGKLPADLTCPIPDPLPIRVPKNVRILRRCTLTLTDTSQNHRLPSLTAPNSGYDLVALRPTNESTLRAACENLECDIISIDLTVRFPTHFKYKPLLVAVSRGIRIELCYGPGVLAADAGVRRNVISNAIALIRATRGRGLIISSEARKALAGRGPWDVINLAAVWGLGQERGHEALTKEAKFVVTAAGLKRTGFRGVVDVIYAGERDQDSSGKKTGEKGAKKRKVEDMSGPVDHGATIATSQQPPKDSKRERKRQAQAARLEAQKNTSITTELNPSPSGGA